MIRQTPIYAGVNKFDLLRERNKAIKILQQAVTTILENGYNPYIDKVIDIETKKYDVSEAFEFVLQIKKNAMQPTSFNDFKSRLNQFEKWLLANGYKSRYINIITKKVVIQYLNEVLIRTSPKNRNNSRISIGTFFETLVDNDIVETNFVPHINVMASKPERNETYTSKQENELFEFLEANEPYLFLFIKFIGIGA